MKRSDDLPFETILLIDSTDREQTCLALIIKGVVSKRCTPERAQELPKLIESFLHSEDIAPKALRALAVISSGGSLTGMRIGVAVVNTLAWKWRIPIIEIDEPGFEQAINKLTSSRFPKVVTSIVEVD